MGNIFSNKAKYYKNYPTEDQMPDSGIESSDKASTEKGGVERYLQSDRIDILGQEITNNIDVRANYLGATAVNFQNLDGGRNYQSLFCITNTIRNYITRDDERLDYGGYVPFFMPVLLTTDDSDEEDEDQDSGNHWMLYFHYAGRNFLINALANHGAYESDIDELNQQILDGFEDADLEMEGLEIIDVGVQNDSYNCGPWTLYFIQRLLQEMRDIGNNGENLVERVVGLIREEVGDGHLEADGIREMYGLTIYQEDCEQPISEKEKLILDGPEGDELFAMCHSWLNMLTLEEQVEEEEKSNPNSNKESPRDNAATRGGGNTHVEARTADSVGAETITVSPEPDMANHELENELVLEEVNQAHENQTSLDNQVDFYYECNLSIDEVWSDPVMKPNLGS